VQCSAGRRIDGRQRLTRSCALGVGAVRCVLQLKAELWFGTRKAMACIRTVTTHVKNMIVGVTKGFLFKMRMVLLRPPTSTTVCTL
jgi:hypothetical protein